MATFNKFNSFVEAMAEKVHNLGSDTLKVALSNTLPVNTNTQLSNITQIAASGGYTAGAGGGYALTGVTSAQSSGTYKLSADDLTITATGGALPTFRYAVLYNDTATNDELIGWWDLTSQSIVDGQSFKLDINPTNGILQIV
jgi:hypothetical protein